MIFFDKGNILISRDTNYTQPLQRRNTLMVDAHIRKRKKILRNKKSRYGIPALEATIHRPPK
jgi:hypothetical protein